MRSVVRASSLLVLVRDGVFANAPVTHQVLEVRCMLLSSRVFDSNAVSARSLYISTQLLDAAPVQQAHFISPSASAWALSNSRRLLDLSVALLVLAVLGLPMLAIALCVRLTSRGPSFFTQYRVGREDHLFRIYKFRTMTFSSRHNGPGLTRDGDGRITRLGRWLRKLKIDELPQFYNVLRGEMSLVGPRPKLPQYLGIANMPYRPGITGAASLAFRREEDLLRCIHPSQMDDFYNRHIRPLKARIDVRYMCRATFRSDVRLIIATFLSCLRPSTTRANLHRATAHALAFTSTPIQKNGSINSFETAV